jgi:hypothetical protein
MVSGEADVWSDFIGVGSAASDYTNGGAAPISVSDLKVQDQFIDGSSYSEGCVIMKGAQNYSLNGEACTTEAHFVCVKKRNFFSIIRASFLVT